MFTPTMLRNRTDITPKAVKRFVPPEPPIRTVYYVGKGASYARHETALLYGESTLNLSRCSPPRLLDQ
jgi:hypothetical protein